jgi:hypothetical protein
MWKLIALVERAPATVIAALTWCAGHPVAVVVLGMVALTAGASAYISGRSHRTKGH